MPTGTPDVSPAKSQEEVALERHAAKHVEEFGPRRGGGADVQGAPARDADPAKRRRLRRGTQGLKRDDRPQAGADRARRGFGPPAVDLFGPLPFPALQSMFDPLVPEGLQNYSKADFVDELSDEAIEAHVEYGAEVPTVYSAFHIYPVSGAAFPGTGTRRRGVAAQRSGALEAGGVVPRVRSADATRRRENRFGDRDPAARSEPGVVAAIAAGSADRARVRCRGAERESSSSSPRFPARESGRMWTSAQRDYALSRGHD